MLMVESMNITILILCGIQSIHGPVKSSIINTVLNISESVDSQCRDVNHFHVVGI